MSPNILSAPVTEFAFIKLKEGKESQRGDLERYIGELQQEISTAEGFHASTWGKSVDPGKDNVYVFVLGWDTVAVEYLSSAVVHDVDDTCRLIGQPLDQTRLVANCSPAK
jgi:hypothetical protein